MPGWPQIPAETIIHSPGRHPRTVVEHKNIFQIHCRIKSLLFDCSPEQLGEGGSSEQQSTATALSPLGTLQQHSPHHQQQLQLQHHSAHHSPASNHQQATSADNLLAVRIDQPLGLLGHQPEDLDIAELEMGPPDRSARRRSPHPAGSEALSQLHQQQQSSPSVVGKERREEAAAMVDPQIRNIWAEAVDLSEIRNVEDQTEWATH